MNIRLGIYDVLSRIVPGGFYLLAFLQIAIALGWAKFDWNLLNNIAIIPSIALTVFTYVLGSALDPFGSAWHRIFKKRGMSTRVLQEFKDKHSDRWKIDFEDKDWPILRAYIGIHNLDVAGDIDRNNALCIMLRNISLGMVLLAIAEILQCFKTFDWAHILYAVLVSLISYQTAIRARTLRDWFYSGIFETMIAYRLDLEARLKPIGKRTK
jgi:hypothetical protein